MTSISSVTIGVDPAVSSNPLREHTKKLRSSKYYKAPAAAIAALATVMQSTIGIQYLARTITNIERVLTPIGTAPELVEITANLDAFIASIRIMYDLKYFTGRMLKQDLKDDAWFNIGCNASFALSDAAASLDYVHDLGLIDVSELAASIGSFSVFDVQPLRLISRVHMAPFMVYTALVGYALMFADNAAKIRRGDRSPATLVYLARSVAEVALKTYLMTSGGFLYTLSGQVVWGLMGAVAAGLAVVSVYLSSYQGFQKGSSAHITNLPVQEVNATS